MLKVPAQRYLQEIIWLLVFSLSQDTFLLWHFEARLIVLFQTNVIIAEMSRFSFKDMI